ncbi:hypothetical protein C1J03_12115 [Sulfitobacter sp. SK012]|uniref:putative Ig domain-containing protein n=1 Tax=Sulfitobacter sp. SK012 TaxID=1389005 RepID=UPI000E0C9585|nr:putative Ig domain-containing protein [Sulfitobacter sp. SK012]AXI46702.1 hypothetical protein C1J03_12115 [Sulfitobacter sp. SK012]
MLQTISVAVQPTVQSSEIHFFAGEALRFEIDDQTSSAEIIITMALEPDEDPLIEVSGLGPFVISAETLESLPEGQTCRYNIWLRDGGDPELAQYGSIMARASIAPSDPGSPNSPTVAPGGLSDVTVDVAAPVFEDLSLGFIGDDLVFERVPGSIDLPNGISLSSTGLLSGASTQEGNFMVAVRASNAGGHVDAQFALNAVAIVPMVAFNAGPASPRLFIDGDSVMAYMPGTRSILEQRLGGLVRFPQDYQQAVGGEAATAILAGLPGVLSRIAPNETIVLMGPIGANQSTQDDSFVEIIARLEAIYGQLRAAGAVVVAVPTLPDESSYGNDAEKDALSAWAGAYQRGGTVSYLGTDYVVAPHAGFYAIDIGEANRALTGAAAFGSDAFNPYTMKNDQSHPNDLGSRWLSGKILEVFEALISGNVLDTANNILGADGVFGGSRMAVAAGITGAIPSNWDVTRTGSADWAMSKNASGELVAMITNAAEPTTLNVIHRDTLIAASAGDVYGLAAEVELVAGSTGLRCVYVAGVGQASTITANSLYMPEPGILQVRTAETPFATATPEVDVRVSVSVDVGASVTVIFKRAAVFFVENQTAPLAITGTPITALTMGNPYSFAPQVAGGGAPYAFDIMGGVLPQGVGLNPTTGEISGTPAAQETQNAISLRVTDTAGDTAILPEFALTVVDASVPENTGLPVIDNTAPLVGDTLAVSTGSWSNAPTGYAYQWLSSGTVMPGETGTNLTVGAAAIGEVLSVQVVASNGNGNSIPVLTAQTSAVEDAPLPGAIAGWDSTINSPAPEQVAYSDNDRTISANANISGARHSRGVDPLGGKVYFELEAVNGLNIAGVSNDAVNYISGGPNHTARCYWSGVLFIHGGGTTNMGPGNVVSDGDIVQFAVDVPNKLLWARRNGSGTWNANASADPTTGTGGLDISGMPAVVHPYVQLKNDTAAEVILHGTADRFAFAAPVGFTAIA